VALTVLDFGRTTFGACTTGTAITCLRLAVEHANRRRQFGRSLGEFELVKKKIARMAAYTYAMEAMTTVTASLIDRGLEDYMLETAMLKVFTTEALWEIVNDAFQIHGANDGIGPAVFVEVGGAIFEAIQQCIGEHPVVPLLALERILVAARARDDDR